MPLSTHLILVCCHAIYLGGPANGASESEWLLTSFQKGEVVTFTEHIKAGLRLLISDPETLLVFSGSKTRPETEKSEAGSYFDLARDNDYFGFLDSFGRDETERILKERILIEEQALDSFGNLLFAIIAFWRKVGAWPGRITIISHEFKRARFLDLHVKALNWPLERVEFTGIDPEYMIEGSKVFNRERTKSVKTGERERGYAAWEADLWGQGGFLRGKREGRNRWSVGQQLFVSDEERTRAVVDHSHGKEDLALPKYEILESLTLT